MPTAQQIKLIHVAAKQAGLNDLQYRTILRNVGGVESSKLLDQEGFESCMAVIEDCGFREVDKPGDYWRQRAAGGGMVSRMARKIRTMAASGRYFADGMARRMSAGRTDVVEELSPREAWQLIEAFKAIEERETRATAPKPELPELPF